MPGRGADDEAARLRKGRSGEVRNGLPCPARPGPLSAPGGYSSARAPAAILNRPRPLHGFRRHRLPVDPIRPDPTQPSPTQPTVLTALPTAVAGARPRSNPRSAPASPPAPRLRGRRGQPAPPPPARHLIVKPHKGTRVRRGRAFPRDRAHQRAVAAGIGCRQALRAPLADTIGYNARLSRPGPRPRRR